MESVTPSSSTVGRLRSLLRAVNRRLGGKEFPWFVPWHRGQNERERAVRRLRVEALRLMRIRARESSSAPHLFTRSLAWPFLLPIKAWQASRDRDQPERGRRFIRGFLDLLCHNLRPNTLRAIRAQRPDLPRAAYLVVSDHENQSLLIELHRAAPHSCLGDKLAFQKFCSEHKLPHIPLLAHGVGGEMAVSAGLPAADLFAKPTYLWGGQGTETLRFNPDTHTWTDSRGEIVGAEDFVAWASRTYGDTPWLVQPLLHVDPSWSAWSPGPLGTVRVVTVIVRPGDAPEIIAASMRLPRAGMTVDNFSAGALSAEINWHTGRLGPALSRSGPRRWFDQHPDTGGLINGATVPDWPLLCELVRNAHAHAPDLVAVGWDVSCRDGRPVLLEANPIFNLAPTVVLGETRWLEAVLHRMDTLQTSASSSPDT